MVTGSRQSCISALFVILYTAIVVLLFYFKPANADPLSEYEWENRPLLIFAQDQNNTHLQEMMSLLQKKTCELDDRDMVIGVILVQGTSKMGNKRLSPNDAAMLRRQFRITGTEFITLLVGKDGGEKYRTNEVPDLADIFALIDGMPMRQDEMMENAADCNKQQ